MFHHVEELAGAAYHMQPGFVQATIIVAGHRITRHLMLHRYGTPRNFAVMEPLFIAAGHSAPDDNRQCRNPPGACRRHGQDDTAGNGR